MNRSRQSTKGTKATVNASRDSTKKSKANKAIVINSGRLETLQSTKVDQILGTILSKANLNVTLKINADQAVVTITSEDDGKRACTIADILRINGFRKFAMDQKKISEASTILDPVLDRFFNAFKMIRAETGMAEFLPPQIQSGPIAAMKDANVIISNLLKNDQVLGKMSKVNTKGASRTMIDMMRNWISITLEIYASLYVKICKGQDTKGFLSEELFAKKIPKWAFDKFSHVDLNEIAAQDIRRLFFPIDVRKGIYLTVREILSLEFRESVSWLLSYSEFQVEILKDDSLIQAITNSQTAISFTNESDPVGTALRSEKVLITPHWFGMDFNIEPRTKKLNNFCANPDFSSPRQGLRTVLEFGLAIQTGDFRIPKLAVDYFEPLTKSVKGLDFVKNVTAKRNFFKILHENAGKVEACLIAQYKLESVESHRLARSLIPMLMRINAESAIATTLISAGCLDLPGIDDTAFEPIVAGYTTVDPDTIALLERSSFDSLNAKVETSADRALKDQIITAAALPTSKQVKKTKTQKFSRLTSAGKRTVKIIRDEPSIEYLAEPVAAWLQGFTTDVIQDVAADLVVAQFGALLSTFESDSEDDSDESVQDSEDDN